MKNLVRFTLPVLLTASILCVQSGKMLAPNR